MAKKPAVIYQLKIQLQGSKPPIWRRVEVLSDITLDTFHEVIQAAMGWDDSHMHNFEQNDRIFEPNNDFMSDGFDMEGEDESKFTLEQLLTTPKQKLEYTYDFGDSWEHTITLEKIVQPDSAAQYPRCIKGKNACPPDDCGGIWGYYEMLEAIKDPEHPDHEDMTEWLEEDFDPNEFDLEEANIRLKYSFKLT
jgi:hypothetical protein